MPTENRRVAAYLPSQIDAALEKFKQDKQLKGDSQALILILSEYLGVSSEVVYQSSSQLQQRVFVVENRLNEFVDLVTDRLQSLAESMRVTQESQESEHGEEDRLTDELLSKLQSKLIEPLDALTKRVEILELQPGRELESESESIPPIQEMPGQLQLIPESSEPQGEPIENSLQPMTAMNLAIRFGLGERAVMNYRSKWKSDFNRFLKWTQEKDPNGIAWEYKPETKLYHPILVAH